METIKAKSLSEDLYELYHWCIRQGIDVDIIPSEDAAYPIAFSFANNEDAVYFKMKMKDEK